MFFSPMLAILAAIGLGIGLSYLDNYLTENQVSESPSVLTTSVDSARSLLATIAGATISFAGTAFSVSLLVIQLSSSQYSPRIVHTIFKDPFNRRIVAMVVGTFTYCLIVMRSVDSRINAGPNNRSVNTVPNVSVAVAVILGILSILAIVAFIDHAAHTMDISQLLETITRDTIAQIRTNWKEDDEEEEEEKEEERNADKGVTENNNSLHHQDGKKHNTIKGEESMAEELDDCHVVRFRSSGWVQEVDFEALKKLVPEHGYMRLHTLAGRYAIPGAAVCSVYPSPITTSSSMQQKNEPTEDATTKEEQEKEELSMLDKYDDNILDAIMIGLYRTMRSDASYGLRELVDVTLRALSPGINDPTTAQDGIFHTAAVVIEFLQRIPPKSVIETDHGGKMFVNEQHDYDSIVRLAYDEVRRCAASSPTVGLYLLESLRLIRDSLAASGHDRRAPEIERQARLIEEGIRNASHIEEDYIFIAQARRDRFDANVTVESITHGKWAAP